MTKPETKDKEHIDYSVACIIDLQAVMQKYVGKLSAMGKNKRAVYAWFKERYDPDIKL